MKSASLVTLVVVVLGGALPTARAEARETGSAGVRFVPASAGLIAECRVTAQAVGYAVPCPLRVPAGLAAYGGRPGCELQIIGPGRRCPDTALGTYTHASWRGWVVGSSIAMNEHLVLTASPRALTDYSKVVNGPAWYPGARVEVLGSTTINGERMHEVYVSPATNDGSAFVGHVVLIWTTGGHTYGVGFHDVKGIANALGLDLKLARSIELLPPG